MLDPWTVRETDAASYEAPGEEQQAAPRGRLELRTRENTYDGETNTIVVDADRAQAVATVAGHRQAAARSNERLLR